MIYNLIQLNPLRIQPISFNIFIKIITYAMMIDFILHIINVVIIINLIIFIIIITLISFKLREVINLKFHSCYLKVIKWIILKIVIFTFPIRSIVKTLTTYVNNILIIQINYLTTVFREIIFINFTKMMFNYTLFNLESF